MKSPKIGEGFQQTPFGKPWDQEIYERQVKLRAVESRTRIENHNKLMADRRRENVQHT